LAREAVTAHTNARSRARTRGLFESTVGLKVAMGVTGVVLTAFVVGHAVGNLLVFGGRAELNRYSVLLHTSSEVLWAVRVGLLASVVVHVRAAWLLTRLAQKARPIAYAKRVPQTATVASRSMRWGGVLIALFVVVHVLHLTTGTIRPAPFSATDVYGNVVGAFRVPWVAAFYLAAMAALGLHLFHGAWAAFRSTGLNRVRQVPMRRPVASVVALCVWAAFSAIPLAVLTGLVK
jgi:succinate dehydrogenase / fumarate reductase cytochrome b subunit